MVFALKEKLIFLVLLNLGIEIIASALAARPGEGDGNPQDAEAVGYAEQKSSGAGPGHLDVMKTDDSTGSGHLDEDHQSCVVGLKNRWGLTFLETGLTEGAHSSYRQTFFSQDVATLEIASALIAPEVIAKCKTVEQVKQAVEVAAACNLKISVRSGGHNYGGYGSCSGGSCMQIDLSQLLLENGKKFKWTTSTPPCHQPGGLTLKSLACCADESSASADTVVVSPGTALGDLYSEFATRSMLMPGGICKHVNAGGHLQSSSVGFFTRFFGLGMDYLEEVKVVTYDRTSRMAQVQTASAKENQGLFFALRGGGPGSWGVVTEYKIKPSPVKGKIGWVSTYLWPFTADRWKRVYAAWKEMHEKEENAAKLFVYLEVISSGDLSTTNPEGSGLWIKAICLYYDPSPAAQIGRNNGWAAPDIAVRPLLAAGSDEHPDKQCDCFSPSASRQFPNPSDYEGKNCTLTLKLEHQPGPPLGAPLQKTNLGLVTKKVLSVNFCQKAKFLGQTAATICSGRPALSMKQLPLSVLQMAATTLWKTPNGKRYHIGSSASQRFWTVKEIEQVATELEKRHSEGLLFSYQLLPYGSPRGDSMLQQKGRQNERLGKITAAARRVQYVDDWIYYNADDEEAAKKAWKSIARIQPFKGEYHELEQDTTAGDFGAAYPGTGNSIELLVNKYDLSSGKKDFWTSEKKLELLRLYHDEATLQKLQEVKSFYDGGDMFQSKLTIPPLQS